MAKGTSSFTDLPVGERAEALYAELVKWDPDPVMAALEKLAAADYQTIQNLLYGVRTGKLR